ncbi:MAG: bifunctional diaminohydroxyphosphoribosylaminopyrimidine deaminase/5-amino-6-(5-phosphoribosylamino)uracil reductase RibD [Sandaracinaceae bacterium]|nr:bifunctional diaminohydroxyphosphoribosylaminopyrimidine deaminase/5-amino-6-(5-phosphoribosylamino)uracil reductase RibD [Sandaracinaceae bacterium]
MSLALRAATRGRPSPNPHVGAVVARGETILAAGHHPRAGQAHAEIVALKKAGDSARGATLYVTFEPCNHQGRTGPCTEAIIAAGIARVVIGTRDPAPHVAGAAEKLAAAGIEVEIGVEEDKARALIADFAQHIMTGLPFVRMKAAMTLDGYIATRTNDSKWITGPLARKHAHRMRDQSDAVIVGVGTVLADDPSLTVRDVRGRDPIRVVLDTHLRTPVDAKLVAHGSRAPTWILHSEAASHAKAKALARKGVELIPVALDRGGQRIDLEAAMRVLGRRDVVRVLAEGGGTLHGSLLDAHLIRRASIFIAPILLGDQNAVRMVAGHGVTRISDAWRLTNQTLRRLGPDLLVEGDVVAAAKAE